MEVQPAFALPMSEEELMKWRAFFNENEPDEAELNGTILEDALPDIPLGLPGQPRVGRRSPMNMHGNLESMSGMYRTHTHYANHGF